MAIRKVEKIIAIQKGVHALLLGICNNEGNLSIKQTISKILWEYIYRPKECTNCNTFVEWMKNYDLLRVQYSATKESDIPFLDNNSKKTERANIVVNKELFEKLRYLVEANIEMGVESNKKILVHDAIFCYIGRPKKLCYQCDHYRMKKHLYFCKLQKNADELEKEDNKESDSNPADA